MGGIIVRGSDGEAMHQSLGRRSSQGMRDAREREVPLLPPIVRKMVLGFPGLASWYQYLVGLAGLDFPPLHYPSRLLYLMGSGHCVLGRLLLELPGR